MGTILWMGTLVGAVLGCAHGVYVYRSMATGNTAAAEGDPGGNRFQAVYYGIWTILLWILFGTYVLVFWAISVLAYGIRSLLNR